VREQAEQRYKPWGEQRVESGLSLYYYGARWYDPSLGRFLSADTIIPFQQGVIGWDRYAGMNNNPVRFNDPSGHGIDCGIGEPNCQAGNYIPPQPANYVTTNAILLDGGPGTSGYGNAAEDNWTGFGESGESSDPGISGPVGAPGLLNDILAWFRDNTDLRERLGSLPDVSGKVFYELTETGWMITGVSITNTSYEGIGIVSVHATHYSVISNNVVSYELLYPHSHPSIRIPEYGMAEPGASSGVIGLSSSVIPNWHYVDVNILIRSESGRHGNVSVMFSFNPPDH
jgi:RHS repeat-associated protein